MKLVAVLVVLAALAVSAVSASEVAVAAGAEVGNCFPDCQWKCDQPSCPAQCTPQCEKPSCELRCEKLAASQCDIRCEKPKCEVRCSKDKCANGGCPICENVCLPARCQTVCAPATPKCKPTCSAPRCTWECRKPANCQKPKCALACASRPKTACENQAKPQCCSCGNFANQASAMEIASQAHWEKNGQHLSDEMMPSLVEVAHEIRASAEEQCCPCAA